MYNYNFANYTKLKNANQNIKRIPVAKQAMHDNMISLHTTKVVMHAILVVE